MTDTVTPKRVREWRAMAAAATPGEWFLPFESGAIASSTAPGIWLLGLDTDGMAVFPFRRDAEFTAAAHEAVPALCGALEEARDERDALAARVESLTAALLRHGGHHTDCPRLAGGEDRPQLRLERDAARAAGRRPMTARNCLDRLGEAVVSIPGEVGDELRPLVEGVRAERISDAQSRDARHMAMWETERARVTRWRGWREAAHRRILAARQRSARHARVLDGLRDILGARPEETLADTARRRMRDLDAACEAASAERHHADILAARVAKLEAVLEDVADKLGDLTSGGDHLPCIRDVDALLRPWLPAPTSTPGEDSNA